MGVEGGGSGRCEDRYGVGRGDFGGGGLIIWEIRSTE